MNKIEINKINKKMFLSILVLLACSVQVCAMIDINLDINEDFFVGDFVSFNYTITSDVVENITYLATAKCPDTPAAMLNMKTVTLLPGVPLSGEYTYFKVTEKIESQGCTAYVIILEPVETGISKNFTINTNPSFNFDILLNKNTFVKNEEVSITYNSEIENVFIEASLTYPDKSTRQISLPYSFKPKQIGTYDLSVIASKEGYKPVSLTNKFGVIEEEVNIGYTDLSKEDEKDGLVQKIINWFKNIF